MATVMLLLFKCLMYALHMREDIKLTQFLLLMFPCVINLVHLPRTLLVLEFLRGTSETFLCFMLVHPSKTVLPPSVPLLQCHFVVILMSSGGKLSQSVFILILVYYYKVLKINYLRILLFVLFLFVS